jgi:HEAT repeat protein
MAAMKITRSSILPAFLTLFSLLAVVTAAQAQDLKSSEPKERAQAAERLGKRGAATDIPALAELLNDPVQDVRSEAVGAIIRIGTQHSLPPLIEATRDAVPEIQATAVD